MLLIPGLPFGGNKRHHMIVRNLYFKGSQHLGKGLARFFYLEKEPFGGFPTPVREMATLFRFGGALRETISLAGKIAPEDRFDWTESSFPMSQRSTTAGLLRKEFAPSKGAGITTREGIQ
jgi:hypothetical protein